MRDWRHVENAVMDEMQDRPGLHSCEDLEELTGLRKSTVQRVLRNLIAQGLVVRVGERRWSLYEMARTRKVA